MSWHCPAEDHWSGVMTTAGGEAPPPPRPGGGAGHSGNSQSIIISLLFMADGFAGSVLPSSTHPWPVISAQVSQTSFRGLRCHPHAHAPNCLSARTPRHPRSEVQLQLTFSTPGGTSSCLGRQHGAGERERTWAVPKPGHSPPAARLCPPCAIVWET